MPVPAARSPPSADSDSALMMGRTGRLGIMLARGRAGYRRRPAAGRALSARARPFAPVARVYRRVYSSQSPKMGTLLEKSPSFRPPALGSPHPF